MGDVISLYNSSGEIVANYEYDAWGKVLSVKNASGTNITSATHIAKWGGTSSNAYIANGLPVDDSQFDCLG